jgi:hypothetical protein
METALSPFGGSSACLFVVILSSCRCCEDLCNCYSGNLQDLMGGKLVAMLSHCL